MRGETQDAWVYDLTSGRVMIHLKIPRVYRTGGLALNRKATLLAVANDHTISVYDLEDGERLAMLQGHQEGWIHAYFEPEGDLLISECRDRIIRVWDPIRGQLLAAFPGYFRGLLGTRSKIVVGQRDDLTALRARPGQGAKDHRLQDTPRAGRLRGLGSGGVGVQSGWFDDRAGHASRRGLHRPVVRRGRPRSLADRPLQRGAIPARRLALDVQRSGIVPLAGPVAR